MTIPDTFTVGQQQMKVTYRDTDEMPSETTLGRCRLRTGEIIICNDQTPTSKENTFIHEAVHSILDTAGYFELSQDETFVSTFAALALEVINSSKKEIA